MKAVRKQSRRNALTLAALVVLMDSIGFGLLAPVLPIFLADIGQTEISGAAGIGLWLSVIYALMQLMFGPFIGAVSDRFGRRPVLIVSSLVLFIDYCIMALASEIWVLFVGRAVAGFAAATFVTAFAIVADVSDDDDRTRNLGVVSAALGVGFVIGPALGGAVGEMFGVRMPIFCAAMFALFNLAFAVCAFNETLAFERRSALSWRKTNPLSSLLSMRQPGLIFPLLMAYALLLFSVNVFPQVWSYFTVAKFYWTPGVIGLSLIAFGAVYGFSQVVLIRLLGRVLSTQWIAVVGTITAALAFIGLAMVQSDWYAVGFLCFGAMGAVSVPALNGLIASMGQAETQGEMQGLIASGKALAYLASPFAYLGTFGLLTEPTTRLYWPGGAFVIAAAAASFAAILIAVYGGEERAKGNF